jgi:DNA-directed RNA polymerase subunit alpha
MTAETSPIAPPDDTSIDPLEPVIETRFDLSTSEPLSFSELERGRAAVFSSVDARDSFRRKVEAMGRSGDEGRRRGFGWWILGDYARCAEELAAHEGGSSPEALTAAFTRARALFSLGRWADALPIFERLASAHPDHPRPRAGAIECRLEIALSKAQDPAAAAQEVEKLVRAAGADFAESGEGLYLLGRAAELRRDPESALDFYSEAREKDPEHRPLLFRHAHLAERAGLDELALSLYESLVALGAPDRNVIYNLGMLYEDLGRDASAAACYDVLVGNDPSDPLARRYFEDGRAGIDMYYDEEMEKKEDRLNQILRIPITDFELSVRARNCLNKMQILTLGDLVQRTEQELLSYKNFGETSLTEIKEILHSKGLRLGMPREEAVASIEAHAKRMASGDRSDVTNRPIMTLQLSIRARRTVETLGCLTVGDITKHSAEELLGMPNFGQTSLQELRSKLTELGLKLKGD